MELSTITEISSTSATWNSFSDNSANDQYESPVVSSSSLIEKAYGVTILICNLLSIEMAVVAFAKLTPVSIHEFVWMYIWDVSVLVLSIEWILFNGQQHSFMIHLVCHTCIFFASVVLTIGFVQDECPNDRWLSIHAFVVLFADILCFLFVLYAFFASDRGNFSWCTAV